MYRVTPHIQHPIPRGSTIEVQIPVCNTCSMKRWNIVRGEIIGMRRQGDNYIYRINTKVPASVPDYNVIKVINRAPYEKNPGS